MTRPPRQSRHAPIYPVDPLVYFGVTLHLAPIVADSPDIDYDPDYGTITADVLFTPRLTQGSVIKATQAVPPTGIVPIPIQAIIDEDGLLKMRVDPDTDSGGTYAPVRLLGNSPALGLTEPLWYDFKISNVRIDGKPSTVHIDGGSFEAPSGDAPVDLLFHMKATGQDAVAVTRVAPSAIRQEGDHLIFSFDGQDIADPVTLTVVNGPAGPPGPAGSRGPAGVQGPQGQAGEVSVGSVIEGETAAVTNTGTPTAAVLNFTLPRGKHGSPGLPGAQGPQGPAGTITVGTVSTSAPGSGAVVVNSGTPTDAILDITIPRGQPGPVGATGDRGEKGDPGAGLAVTGRVATVADLPADLTEADAGTAFFVEDDGKLYIWTGTAWPADGAQFQGPPGSVGATGAQGSPGVDGQDGADGRAATITIGTVTTAAAGGAASVVNSGTTTDATFDFTLPRGADGRDGDPGATGPQGSPGQAATIQIGTVSTGSAGSAVSVINSGTPSAAVFDFAIPRGAAGTTDWNGITNKPNFVVADGAGQASDVSMVVFGAATVRAAGSGDNPFGVRLMRNVQFTNAYFRCATPDVSGDLVVELRKNGVALPNSQVTIAAANQVVGGSVTGLWGIAAGEVLTVNVVSVGGGAGKGLVCDLRGVTT